MDSVQPADEDIVVRIGTGDDSGIEVLYDRYSRVIFSLLLKMVQNQQVAEELTQEVFLRIWQQASSFQKERGRFVSWALGIAHHMAIDEIRRRKARPQQVYDDPKGARSLLEVADRLNEPDELALGEIRRECVVEALAQLPGSQREVIAMSYFGGLTQTQIAERKGEPLGTIKTRTRLGLQRLRLSLLEQGIRSDTL